MKRIEIVDVLRGFALLLIVLIHFVEHFDLFQAPEVNYLFSKEFDHELMKTTFLLFSGKAYSIFALLFGLSFFIQMDNKAQRGVDYRRGFIWRMTVLLFIGIVHSMIYRGDILHVYAVLSFALILLHKVSAKYLWGIAALLTLQIPMISILAQTFINPDYEYIIPIKIYWREGNAIYLSGSFLDVLEHNLWKGRITAWWWYYDTGRCFQLIALFIAGLILGRNRVFENIEQYYKKWILGLLLSAMVILILAVIKNQISISDLSDLQKSVSEKILTSYINIAATSGIISLLVLLYIHGKGLYVFKLFAAYGKMSLSNYIFQAVFGIVFFYGFGLAMYKYLGATWSLMLGGMVFFLQAFVSIYWNKAYYYGPLEWFWRCCTNRDFSVEMKRK